MFARAKKKILLTAEVIMGIDQARRILQKRFSSENWTITLPKDGRQQECYVAQSETQRVFLKFHTPITALQRLSEIGVAPRLLGSDIDEGKLYIVQEYITGTYPDWRWFAGHLSSLASFVLCYHNDQPLTELLAENGHSDYKKYIEADLARLENQYASLHTEVLHTSEVSAAFNRLIRQAERLRPVQLVPVHPDPNTKNILLVGDTIFMIDWDDVLLSDPMRDVGLLLWWYVSQGQWSEFFDAYGLAMDEDITERIFWWAARTSFAVALWHVEYEYDCTSFLRDFLAALNREGNPRAVFPG